MSVEAMGFQKLDNNLGLEVSAGEFNVTCAVVQHAIDQEHSSFLYHIPRNNLWQEAAVV